MLSFINSLSLITSRDTEAGSQPPPPPPSLLLMESFVLMTDFPCLNAGALFWEYKSLEII